MTVKKIKKHFKYHGSSYLKLALVCSVFIGMIIVAVVTKDEKESEKSGDTQSSSLASASYEKKYGEAEELLASGNKAEAERLMKKMAFLSDDGVSPRGYAPAHLWMAKNMLKKLDPVFLYEFPLELKKGKHVVVPLSLREGDTVTLAQRHLEHADYLAPELKEPPLLLAALWIARAQREKAYKVLLSSICDKENPQVELIIPFVNLLNYEGDDIALQEMSWHAPSPHHTTS